MTRVREPSLTRYDEATIRPNLPVCPNCTSPKHVVKAGIRKTSSRGSVQRYKCTECRCSFTPTPIPSAVYPPKVIAFALSYYNLGHTHEETKATLKRKMKVNAPLPTLQSWVERYQSICTFVPLRKRYIHEWRTTIVAKKLYHQQVYEFKHHNLKTNIAAKAFPQIRTYLKTIADSETVKPGVHRRAMTKIFKDSTLRCSTFKAPTNQPSYKKQPKAIRENNATKMTQLALTLAKTRTQRHEAIEDFFLTNDSSTIAVEIPVYIQPKEAWDLKLKEPLTGHIDILQFRNKKIQILDYKPEKNPGNARNQLELYKRALSIRTKIPLYRIQTAAFNENIYVEF